MIEFTSSVPTGGRYQYSDLTKPHGHEGLRGANENKWAAITNTLDKKMVPNPKRVDHERENNHGQPEKESYQKESWLSKFYHLFHPNKGVKPKLPKVEVTS